MRKVMLVFFTCVTSVILAQETKRQYTIPSMEGFIGVWEYTADHITFQLVLQKGYYNIVDSYGDCIIGGYKISKDGVVLEDYTSNLPKELLSFRSFTASFVGFNLNSESCPKIFFNFRDKGFNKGGEGEMHLLSATTARFILENPEGVRLLLEGETSPPKGFSVPTDMVLTKVE